MSIGPGGFPEYFGQLVSFVQYYVGQGDTRAEAQQRVERRYGQRVLPYFDAAFELAEFANELSDRFGPGSGGASLEDLAAGREIPGGEVGFNYRFRFDTGQVDPDTGRPIYIYRSYKAIVGQESTYQAALDQVLRLVERRYGETIDLEPEEYQESDLGINFFP